MTPLHPSRSVVRLTPNKLGHQFGRDKNKPLVATLQYTPTGALLTLRPHKTRRAESALLEDIYSYMLRCKVNRMRLEKAREAKAKKAERAQRARSMRVIRGGGE